MQVVARRRATARRTSKQYCSAESMPRPEQVELHQADRRAVVLVPLQDGAAGHPAPLDRAHLDHRPVADHHAAGVDAQVPRRVLQLRGQLEHLRGDRVVAGSSWLVGAGRCCGRSVGADQ